MLVDTVMFDIVLKLAVGQARGYLLFKMMLLAILS